MFMSLLDVSLAERNFSDPSEMLLSKSNYVKSKKLPQDGGLNVEHFM